MFRVLKTDKHSLHHSSPLVALCHMSAHFCACLAPLLRSFTLDYATRDRWQVNRGAKRLEVVEREHPFTGQRYRCRVSYQRPSISSNTLLKTFQTVFFPIIPPLRPLQLVMSSTELWSEVQLAHLPPEYLAENQGRSLLLVSIAFFVVETVFFGMFMASRVMLLKNYSGVETWLFMPLGYMLCVSSCALGICQW